MEADREITNLGPDGAFEAEPQALRTPKRRVIGRRAVAERAAAKAGQDGWQPDSAGALSSPKASRPIRALNQVPPSITEDPDINAAIDMLPSNYSFEIPKTIHRIRTSDAKNVALQFPEGLLLFAPMISDILTTFCPGTDTLIMGDVTYGACCVDDYTARALGCDLLIHYGHSCLVPMSETGGIKTLYVFVTIGIDVEHLVKSIERNFQPGKKIALVGTIQFNTTLHAIVPRLRTLGYEAILPRSAPLSAGEILGCTAPTLTSSSSQYRSKAQTAATSIPAKADATTADMILYVGDGRFHLESILISSPALRAHTYRYDPYARKLTHETYDHHDMHSLRRAAVQAARETLRPRRRRLHKLDGQSKFAKPQHTDVQASSIGGSTAKTNAADSHAREDIETIGSIPTPPPTTWGLILGTLGRQGNPHTLSLITSHLTTRGHPYVTLLLSEITPQKLALMSRDVGVWVQVACPRLSIDWGYAFERPLLSPYEACVALWIKEGSEWADGMSDAGEKAGEDVQAEEQTLAQEDVAVYPMDYYEKSGLGRTRVENVPEVQAPSARVSCNA